MECIALNIDKGSKKGQVKMTFINGFGDKSIIRLSDDDLIVVNVDKEALTDFVALVSKLYNSTEKKDNEKSTCN